MDAKTGKVSGSLGSEARLWGLCVALFAAWIVGKLLERGIIEGQLAAKEEMWSAGISLALQAVGAVCIPIAVYLFAVVERGNGIKWLLFASIALALAAEVPFDILCSGKIFNAQSQNPIFGICLSVAVSYICASFKNKGAISGVIFALAVAAAIGWALILRCMDGVLCILLAAVMMLMKKKEAYAPMAAASILAAAGAFSPLLLLSPLGVAAVYGNLYRK